MELGLVTAFLGGMLALLSPCGALLLPAFFASTIGTGPRLLLHGAVYYFGLLLVLVPLGVGAGALGSLFITHRGLIIGVSSAMLIVLGILQIFGLGFDPSKLVPGSQKMNQKAAVSVGLTKTLLLGAAGGLAGFCAGPVLGAVLTLAAAQGSVVLAGILLAVYGAGMLVPLLILVMLWDKIGNRTRGVLRGRVFQVFGREFHSTSVLTGALILGAGILFATTNGLVDLPSLVPTSTLAWLQGGTSVLANPLVDILVIVGVALAGLGAWMWTSRKQRIAAEAATQSVIDS